MGPDQRCQFLAPLLINLQLEHDAGESLTAAPPTQVVGLTYSTGDNVCAPSRPHWLESQKATSVFRLQVVSENREDFPSETLFFANTSRSAGSAAGVTPRSTPAALVPSGPLLTF